MIRFLHAADLHLGLRITRFEEAACQRVGEARFTSLQQLRAKGAELKVDFIVIAGDVFDDHSISKTDASRALPILETGRSENCPVYLIPGNHDPLVPGGVWDRDPWLREQPHLRVHFLRTPEPVTIPNLPVTLFPCPLKQRRSMDDPTAWMANFPRNGDPRTYRIGLAHGSLRVMKLPDDDHLIRPDAALHYGLDYLALGHWHKEFRYRSADGVERTAYSGTHEPMSFAGGEATLTTGWASYSSDGNADRFQDDGHGRALLVTIDAPGAPPQIETIEIGRLRWQSEQRDMTGHSLGSLIGHYSEQGSPELTILRLALHGVMDPQAHTRLVELQRIVENRYHAGSSLDASAVLIEPKAEQLSEVVVNGVLRRVLDRLQSDTQSTDPRTKQVAQHALKILYRLAWEEQPT